MTKDYVSIGGVKMSVAAARNLEAIWEKDHLERAVRTDITAYLNDPEGWVASITADVGEPEYAQGWREYVSAIRAAAHGRYTRTIRHTKTLLAFLASAKQRHPKLFSDASLTVCRAIAEDVGAEKFP